MSSGAGKDAGGSESKRVCTLETCLVDAPLMNVGKHRVVVQSIIPGILQGDQVSKLIFGAIEHGTPLVKDPFIDVRSHLLLPSINSDVKTKGNIRKQGAESEPGKRCLES